MLIFLTAHELIHVFHFISWFFIGYNCSFWWTRGHAKRILHWFCEGGSGWRQALHPPCSTTRGAGFILWSIAGSWWPLGLSHCYFQGSVGTIGSWALRPWGEINYRNLSCFCLDELYGVEIIPCCFQWCLKHKIMTSSSQEDLQSISRNGDNYSNLRENTQGYRIWCLKAC